MKEEFILLVGNFTFAHNLTPEEKKLFKADKKSNVFCHEIDTVLLFTDKYKAYDAAEETESSFLILPLFKGEIIFESEELKQKTIEDINLLTQSVKLP